MQPPEPIREVIVGGLAVPIGETIGVRVICRHADTGRGEQFSTLTINLEQGTDVTSAVEAGLEAVEAGLFTQGLIGSPRGFIEVCWVEGVYIGGFDNPNFIA